MIILLCVKNNGRLASPSSQVPGSSVYNVEMSKRPNNHPPVCQKSCSRMVGIYNMDVSSTYNFLTNWLSGFYVFDRIAFGF